MISKSELLRKSEKFADAKIALQVWLETVEQAEWSSLEDIRATYPATDMIGKVAIFNIKGGNYRLIVRIEFAGRRIYIKEFLTHAGYNREAWKKWL